MATAICQKCGEIIPGRADNCLKCGTSRSFVRPQEAPAIPASVAAGATKSGSQGWSAFETHAQRTQGISHEESMQKIDAFVGKLSSSEGVQVDKVAGPALMSDLGKSLQRNGIKVAGGMNAYVIEAHVPAGGGSGSGGTSVTEITETTYSVEGERKDGPIAATNTKFTPQPGQNSADMFLQQHLQTEAAKYKPGYANRNPNGVR